MKTTGNAEAQNSSSMFILKEQNGSTNGSIVKSFTLKRNGVKKEEQENHAVLQQKSATLPAVIPDSKKKITVSKK
ncbi:hypothetical protein L9F63_008829, partial [Diploptera punctata]